MRETERQGERGGGKEGAAGFRQETAGKIVDRRSIEIKGASCNNSLICDQLIQSRGGKRYQSRVNSQSAAWIKLHSISVSPPLPPCGTAHTPHTPARGPAARSSLGASAERLRPRAAPPTGDDAPREHPREAALGCAPVKGRGGREGRREGGGAGPGSPGGDGGRKHPHGSHSGFAQRVRVPLFAPGEESKQLFLNQSARAYD